MADLKKRFLKRFGFKGNEPSEAQKKMQKRYHTQFTIKEVCDIIGVRVPLKYRRIQNDVLTNLSYYRPPFVREDGGFLIRKSAKGEVEEHLKAAVREKVKVVFTNCSEEEYPILKEVPHIYCKKPLSATLQISAKIRNDLNIKVVGITGSLGKTTTKNLIHSVIGQAYNVEMSQGNQNTIFPMFDNLQKLPHDTDFYIQEFGAAAPDIMPNTVKGCIPDIGVITNISDPHMDRFGSKENILKEKLRLITTMPKGCPAFFNYDDELLKKVELEDYPIVTYAINNKDVDYYAENIELHEDNMTFDIVSNDTKSSVTLYLLGEHNVYNALAAYAIGKWIGMSEEDIVNGLASFKPKGIRQNLTNIGGYNMYIDCYNNAPKSMVSSVHTLEKLKTGEGGRRIAVLGDMSLLGEREKELHIWAGQEIAKANIDKVLCFGEENAELMAEEIRKSGIETYCTNDRAQLNQWIETSMTKEDVLLFKGPVVRLLSKTIDQIFGTTLHVESESIDTFTYGDFRVRVIWEKYHKENKTVAIIRYTGSEKSVKVLEEYEGIDVFAIGPNCFLNNNTIENVEMGGNILGIGASAFRNCSKLRSVTLPDSLKNINANAFRNDKNLESIVIPHGVIEIGNAAFSGCEKLKKVVIPDTVGRIGENAFEGCKEAEFVYEKGSYAESYFETN